MTSIRKSYILFIICIIFTTMCGCWSARELENLAIVSGIGLDKAENSDNILITAQIVKPADLKKPSKDTTADEGKPYLNIESSSETLFDALREFTHVTGKKLYFAHTQVIVLGKDIANQNVQKNLDFFMRSHETRPTTQILISGSTAKDILDSNPETDKLPAVNITKLTKANAYSSHALEVNLQDFTSRLLSKTTSPIAPIVTISEEQNKKIAKVEGIAVFKKDRLVGTLNEAESRGLIFVLGKIKSGAINVAFKDGKASLEIKKSKTKLTTKMIDDNPAFNIKITLDSNLVEQTYPDNLASLSGFKLLENRQNEIIKNEIFSVIKKAKEFNTDIFGFGDKVHKEYKNEWKHMENDWDKIFPNIDIDIEIESKVRASGLITKPLVPGSVSGEEK